MISYDARGRLQQPQIVHLAKGTKLYAFAGYMCKQEFVIYDDNMNAVEIYEGKLEDVTVDELNNRFFPLQKIDKVVKPISEKFGIGFYYDESGELISDEMIENSLERAKILERLKQEKEEATARANAELREQLIKEYSYLTRVEGFNHKICGQNLRTELKHKFPGIKFSVRHYYSTHDSTYVVSWTDGPSRDEVKEVIDKYKSYKIDSPSVFNKLFGGVEYIQNNRTISEGAKDSIREEYKDLTNENLREYKKYKEQDEEAVRECLRFLYRYCTVDQIIDAIAMHRSF